MELVNRHVALRRGPATKTSCPRVHFRERDPEIHIIYHLTKGKPIAPHPALPAIINESIQARLRGVLSERFKV